MDHDRHRILNCSIETDLLAVLADRIIDGTLIPEARSIPLFQWRIFLPTRRAVRRLEHLLFAASGQKAISLPIVSPIGDIDEGGLDQTQPLVPDAISRQGLLYEIVNLLQSWAQKNPQFALAQDISGLFTRIQHLAESLLDLLDQVETEEGDFDKLLEVYDLDLAGHRVAILDVLEVLRTELPQRLASQNLIGPSDHRNRMIRKQAEYIRQQPSRAPLIIAGSTGSNPATRDLIKAVADDPLSCVILPGVDKQMSDADWLSLKSTHPQYNLRALIQHLGIPHGGLPMLQSPQDNRDWLAAEIMRPAESSDLWHSDIEAKAGEFDAARRRIRLVECPNRHIEARTIALILRQAMIGRSTTVALITPDQDLASRVKVEFARWGVEVDDTRGEPLTKSGPAHLLKLLCQLVLDGISPLSLIAVLRDEWTNFSLTDDLYKESVNLLEERVLRQQGMGAGLAGFKSAVVRTDLARGERYQEPEARRLQDEQWAMIKSLTERIDAALAPLEGDAVSSLGVHISTLMSVLTAVSENALSSEKTGEALARELEACTSEQHRLPTLTLAEAVPLILAHLDSVTVRPPGWRQAPVAIYGLLEARLMKFDVVVLGGLNEGVWPAAQDSGPWLSRPMRDSFGLQQPERDIGLTAHDFVSGLGNAEVHLTWSQRIGGDPATPSRWILRFRAILQAFGITKDKHCDQDIVALALQIDRPPSFRPLARPEPKPPVEHRPRRFSVTEIERLNRDPYSVYARRMLRLKPLNPLAQEPDARLRGILFHEIMERWNKSAPLGKVPAPLDVLIEAGRTTFMPLHQDADVMAFWWPRFMRVASWILEQELELRKSMTRLYAEQVGRIEFVVAGEKFELTSKADRIDVLDDGTVKPIDYKTGKPPSEKEINSGFSPQLTLEANMLEQGGFSELGRRRTSGAIYIRLSGGAIAGEVQDVEADEKRYHDFSALVAGHRAGLERKLAAYLNQSASYPPRVKVQREELPTDYDHLSRFLEWSISQ